jgi:hypothetical protein
MNIGVQTTLEPVYLDLFSSETKLGIMHSDLPQVLQERLADSAVLNNVHPVQEKMSSQLSASLIQMIEEHGIGTLLELINLAVSGDHFVKSFGSGKVDLDTIIHHGLDNPYLKAIQALHLENEGGLTPFSFKDQTGIYSFNKLNGVFERDGDSQFVVIKFPACGNCANNAVLRISDYDEVMVNKLEQGKKGDKICYFPNRILAYITIDSIKQVELNYEVKYNIHNGKVENAVISLFLRPHTYFC